MELALIVNHSDALGKKKHRDKAMFLLLLITLLVAVDCQPNIKQ